MIEEICISPDPGAPMLSLPSVEATKGVGGGAEFLIRLPLPENPPQVSVDSFARASR